jgi:hypothetical protein
MRCTAGTEAVSTPAPSYFVAWTTLFRLCSALLYKCPDAGVYATWSWSGKFTILHRCWTMLNSFFDVVVHMSLSLSIISKSSMRRCNVAFPQVKREKYRQHSHEVAYVRRRWFEGAHTLLNMFRVSAVHVPRCLWPLADKLAFVHSCRRQLFVKTFQCLNVCPYKHVCERAYIMRFI